MRSCIIAVVLPTAVAITTLYTRRPLPPRACIYSQNEGDNVPAQPRWRALAMPVPLAPFQMPVELVAASPPLTRDAIRHEMLIGARAMVAVHSTLLLASIVARFVIGMILFFAPEAQVTRATAIWNGFCGVATFNPFLQAESFAKVGQFACLGVASWPRVGQVLYQGASSTVIGPVYEELAYRGGAQWLALRAVQAASPAHANASSAVLFSRMTGASFFALAHAERCADTLDLAFSPQKVAGTFMSSLLIESRVAHARRSVWAAAGAHMAYNALIFTPTARWVVGTSLTALFTTRQTVYHALQAGARRADVFGGVLVSQLLVLLISTQFFLRVHRWLCARVLAFIDRTLELEEVTHRTHTDSSGV